MSEEKTTRDKRSKATKKLFKSPCTASELHLRNKVTAWVHEVFPKHPFVTYDYDKIVDEILRCQDLFTQEKWPKEEPNLPVTCIDVYGVGDPITACVKELRELFS